MNEEGSGAPRVKRMLPSVSEVLKALTARASVEPDVAFRVARDVCAEELKRIRDAGGASVPLDELVERALARIPGGRPVEPVRWPAPPSGRAFEPEPAAVPPPVGGLPVVDDPFSETTGALDLRWDRETREPFGEAQPAERGAVAATPLAPPLAEEVVEPPAEPAELPGTAVAPLVPAAAEAATAASADAVEELLPAAPAPVLRSDFGDETLSRLSKEAEAIDLRAVFREGPGRPAVERVEAPPRPEIPRRAVAPAAPLEDEGDTVLTVPRGGRRPAGGERRSPRLGLVLGVAAGLIAVAGLGYLLVGLWMERDGTPVPVVVARPRAEATKAPAGSAPPATVASPAPAAPDAAPAGEPGRGPVPTATPVPIAAAPSPVAAMPVPTPPATAGAQVRQSRDGLVVTRDRAGQPEVFSIHFTSYRDRAAAERDLRRVAALAGRDGYVAEVDLGEKGVWFRVMVGAFSTAEEAKAVREELAAKGTPDMGWVYRVVGP